MNDMIRAMVTTGVTGVAIVIVYIIESIFLSKIAVDNGKNPLLAWIPVLNFFLLRDIAGKKSRWQWLLGFLAAALLGASVVRWIGMNMLMWSMLIWYWAAFFEIADRKNINMALCVVAIFFLPVKWYVMYKIAE